MDNMIGKKIAISGMTLEIISDAGEKWACRNMTTNDIVYMSKDVITKTIKLGKAEVIDPP